MRIRTLIALCLACVVLLLLSASALASGKGSPVEGKPWTGSYLRSTAAAAHTRVVWLQWQGIYNTWADGGPDWNRVWGNTNMGVKAGKVTGDVSRVLKWEWPTFQGKLDTAHPNGGTYTSAGRVKVQLKPGNGVKVVKLRYSLKIVQQYNNVNFMPYFPASPTYKKTIKLAL